MAVVLTSQQGDQPHHYIWVWIEIVENVAESLLLSQSPVAGLAKSVPHPVKRVEQF